MEITLKDLAEALDHELDSSWVGGRELAVNVFAYLERRREPGRTSWTGYSKDSEGGQAD